MKILVLGKDGQVGWHLQKVIPQAIFWGRMDLDLVKTESIGPAILKEDPDCIINAAAYTAVDKAESEPELARTINALAVKELAIAARKLAVPLLHLSTDYVFSGESDRPYRESDATGPRSIYGKTKLEGELLVREHCEKCWIIRTSWVFSEHGSNFVKTMLRLGKQRDSLGIVSDQKGCPTYAGDLAGIIWHVIESIDTNVPLPWGVYHFACNGEVSWYGFAREILEQAYNSGALGQMPVLSALASQDYPLPATRPRNSCLDTAKLQRWYGRGFPAWREALKHVINA